MFCTHVTVCIVHLGSFYTNTIWEHSERNKMLIFRLSTLVGCLAMVHGYPYFGGQIPNAGNLPNPCNPSEMAGGVGHLNPQGGGARNQFGKDLKANGYSWQNICNMDSDKDGLTNGQELGDPQCVWTPGSKPARTTGLSHPGFCQPLDSPLCQASEHKLTCNTFDCPAISEPGVQSRVLRFPRTSVPSTETNYMCMTFDLDQTRDYHMIATRGEIDNVNVMHHILLYGCQDGAEAMETPTACGMSSEMCQDVIGLWTVGMAGECMYKEAGFRIGKTGYKRVLLEFHWNNPKLQSGYFDASGMTIYFTHFLRRHDAGIFWTGQTSLEIPPNRDRVVFESVCSSECTRMFNQSIYFTQGLNHMHYKGIAQSVELTSNGVSKYITNEQDYNYDSPKVYVYDTPIEVRPGDSLKTTCVFKSRGAKKTTFFGPATSDEMCFGLFTYFPKEAVTQNSCTTFKNFQRCKLKNGNYGDCNLNSIFNTSAPDTERFLNEVLDSCSSYGGCRSECPAAIDKAMRHPCLRGGNKEWSLHFSAAGTDAKLVKFAAAMTSCTCKPTDTTPPMTWPSAGTGATKSALLSVTMVTVIGLVFSQQ